MLTYEEEKILKALGTGEANACTYKTLAWRTRINERTVREIVASLVKDKHYCICTNSQSGYYFASNREEWNHADKELGARIRELAKRKRGLRIGYKERVAKAEQLSLV